MSSTRQNLNKLRNKKICMLGFGIENQALVKFLIKENIPCEITICDARKKQIFEGEQTFVRLQRFAFLHWRLGKNYDKNLDQFDIVFRVAGYPLFSPEIEKAKKAGVEISSPTKLFFELCPTKNIIGVTGTKGKGTTASLIYYILKKGFRRSPLAGDCGAARGRVWLGGNIGIAPFEFIDKIKKNDWVVLELSSFQLEDMDVSPKIAVITNFHKEHLSPADPNNPNYHKTLRDYWNAKMNIVKRQKKGDKAIINQKLKIKYQKQILKNKKTIFFTKSKLLSKLVGEYNKENIAAAVGVAKLVGIKQNIIKEAVAGFKGLEHRIESAGSINGVKYYDDSFATTPESAITALKSFSQPIILLAGGADKGSGFKQFAKEIKKRVKFVILLNGKATSRIKTELLKIKYPKNHRNGGTGNIKLAYNIKDAVSIAEDKAVKGDIVLLSTGCASFGMFKNYKERGKLFKEEVNKIKKE
ncbi:UDP-N-acetylmuramoyl-L-alanine--D-glutamate ligase [Patescibacteria group bacterium]|nr:UDP-N-acetylmuramoyl-L-alanine--D-glutamate ligase [Candidatus Falkowbacteria bacterium]MBU3905556.1 UDP-N-acetylmuramoyl-L-alanine--D-glutamate ligase [Patescibacteria group bacterium]MBU4015669.1 UDP-N-acetylmuramoyl-L-alanine--D-glutamate ligase [Patescibacteria group bacterium]MBU4026241.1 UDP-N-acetylmuramoyl-L-alanine--D-glutamate ligase [Patescibacteria group bacterium]MBU4073102.1 UDP-N-acetylmuramoyl-L-alanine--D-glutamate ligase [Patescibacteria group bacterium]